MSYQYSPSHQVPKNVSKIVILFYYKWFLNNKSIKSNACIQLKIIDVIIFIYGPKSLPITDMINITKVFGQIYLCLQWWNSFKRTNVIYKLTWNIPSIDTILNNCLKIAFLPHYFTTPAHIKLKNASLNSLTCIDCTKTSLFIWSLVASTSFLFLMLPHWSADLFMPPNTHISYKRSIWIAIFFKIPNSPAFVTYRFLFSSLTIVGRPFPCGVAVLPLCASINVVFLPTNEIAKHKLMAYVGQKLNDK